MKLIVLLNGKMPTVVGILTVISKINAVSESLKARTVYIFQQFFFLYEKLTFYDHVYVLHLGSWLFKTLSKLTVPSGALTPSVMEHKRTQIIHLSMIFRRSST